MQGATVFVAAGAASMLAAGCGGGGSAQVGSRPASPLFRAVENTQLAETHRVVFHLQVNAEREADDFDATGTAVVDRIGKKGQLAYVLSGSGRELPFEVRILGNTMYQKFPPLIVKKDLPPGKPWVRFPLAGTEMRFPANLARGSGAFSPNHVLTGVLLAREVEEVGVEDRRGVSTTHYRGSIQVDDLLKANQSAEGESELRRMRAAGTESLGVDAWVGARDFIHAVRMHYGKMAASGDLPAGDMTLELDLSGFGRPVSVKRPPSHQVSDFEDVFEGASS